MKDTSTKAFTTIEFLVTLILVALIGSVAYFSYIGYSESARDSKRAEDIVLILRALEGYSLSYAKFPEPGSSVSLTYSGSEVWRQGTFGEITDYTMGEIDSVPVDPSTGNLYAYSVTKNNKEFQVSSLYETFIVQKNLLNQANADSLSNAEAFVRGNYNGIIAKATDGAKTYVLALPSILSSDLSYTRIEDILEKQILVYHGFGNLTDNYRGGNFEVKGGFSFNPQMFIVYETDDTKKLSEENEQLIFYKNIQDAYRGTSVANRSEMIHNIMNTDVDKNKSSALKIAKSYIYSVVDKELNPKY